MSLLFLLRRREITASGIVSTEAVGSPSLSSVIAALGILPSEVFGDVTVELKAVSVPRKQSAGVAWRRLSLPLQDLPIGISAIGIISEETVGKPAVIRGRVIAIVGIESAERFGRAEIIIPAQVLLARQRYEEDEMMTFLRAA